MLRLLTWRNCVAFASVAHGGGSDALSLFANRNHHPDGFRLVCDGAGQRLVRQAASQFLAGRTLGADILKQLRKPKPKVADPPSRKP